MKPLRFLGPLFLSLVIAFGAQRVRAQVIYNNMGSETTFPYLAAFQISGTSEAAVQFTAGQSLFVDYVDLRMWHGLGTTFNVALLANTLTDTPGAVLESTSSSFQLFYTNPLPVTRVEFSNTTLLTAGLKYWLALSPNAGTTTGWDYAYLPQGLVATDSGMLGFNDAWSVPFAHEEGAMRIMGVAAAATAVPEPSVYGIAGSAALLVLGLRRRFAKIG